MIEANRYKLGIFVIAAITLMVVILFMLGIAEVFKPKFHFVTLFDESVQGLETGASVKFRGVILGKVTRVALREEDNYIRVDMEALLSNIEPASTTNGYFNIFAMNANKFKKLLKQEIRKGLRCRLELQGITGMKYVELDYYKDEKELIQPTGLPKDIFYVPSTPSLLSSLRTSLEDSLVKIATIDFKEISNELVSTLKSVNSLLNDPRINTLIDKMENISGHLEITAKRISDSLTEDTLKQITDELKQGLGSIDDLAKSVKKQLESAQLPETASVARNTMKETSSAAKSITEIRQDLSRTLTKLNETLDSFTELVNYIEEDPNSLIRGKQKTENF